MKIKGIHHISTIVWHAQENVDFYAGVLGLRLIKRTLNFDDHKVYHLYYGNQNGDLGTAITFFPWPKNYKEGMIGDGQVAVTSYMIPKGSLNFWQKRLDSFGIEYETSTRLGDKFLLFKDPHGIKNELIETDVNNVNTFEFNGVTKDVAIQGFYGAMMYSSNYKATKAFLIDELGLVFVKEDDAYARFDTGQTPGRYVDVYKHSTGRSKMGAGTVHHIAFGVKLEDIETWKANLIEKGFHVTGVRDRKFFKSIYFREPGGTIIELATTKPGFKPDEVYLEEPELFMPPHYEHLREEVEAKVMPLFVRPIDQLRKYPYEDKMGYEVWQKHQELLTKINYYAKEVKVRQLTDEELEERNRLRQAYVQSIRGAIQENLDNIQVEDEKGNYQALKKKEGPVQ